MRDLNELNRYRRPAAELEFYGVLGDHETVMQLHVPPSDHISYHPYCLHLWRPLTVPIPRPPAYMVGPAAEVDHE